MTTSPLDGLHILVLEDEFLIAMDLEQICRDNGAANVTISRTLEGIDAAMTASPVDAAIVDLRLGGVSTLDFAQHLYETGTPFVFATGYGPTEDLLARFAEVPVVMKPYIGEELIAALARTIAGGRQPRL